MLPQKRRIGRKEFTVLLSRGKRYNSPHFLLYIATKDSNPTKESRFSFSMSKKVASLATTRNRYRRRGYAVLQKHIQSIVPGYDCFFSFKKGSSSAPFSVLEKEILELLSSGGVIS